jgi:hypothetical protein
MKRLLTRTVFACVATLGLASAASAAGAYVCHPDPAGTRTMTVNGEVARYAMHGSRVTVLSNGASGCRRIVWNVLGRTSLEAADSCSSGAAAKVAAQGQTRVALREGTADEPDRIDVRVPGRTRSWPLPERAFSLDVDGQTAVLSTLRSREIYAVDLRTGRSAIVGLSRRLDTPQIERTGVVFRDNLDKENRNDAKTLMKFVPRAYVAKALASVGTPLRFRGHLVDLAMDGSRVALAAQHWRNQCDAVLYWNITWRYSVPITEDDEHTCEWSRSGGSIQSISLAGLRAAWTMRVGTQQRLLAASSVDCFERIVATARAKTGERVIAASGDDRVLAYSVVRGGASVLGRVGVRMRAQTLVKGGGAPISLSADGGRIAVLRSGGELEIRDGDGALVRSLTAPGGRAVALRAGRVAVLTRNALDLFDVETGVRLHSWPVPRRTYPRLDMQYGIAVVTTGQRVVAISLSTGRRFVAATIPDLVGAQIEAPGIAYAYNSGRYASVEYVPFARLERALGTMRR